MVEKTHSPTLIEHIGLLTDERSFHLKESPREELFKLTDQRLSDTFQFAFALGDGVQLDALGQHLDQRC
jgi:hypothetical protein